MIDEENTHNTATDIQSLHLKFSVLCSVFGVDKKQETSLENSYERAVVRSGVEGLHGTNTATQP